MVSIWKERKVFTPAKVRAMVKKAKSIDLPPGYESMARNMESNFSNIKGDQWRVFATVTSPFILHEVLPAEQYTHWMLFVDACRLLFKPTITKEEAEEAHRLFVKFGKTFTRVYPLDAPTSNMHMATHFLQNVMLYGSIYSWWLFSFERTNKLMKSISINNKGTFEVTILESFLKRKNSPVFIDKMADPSTNIKYLDPKHAAFLHQFAGYNNSYSDSTPLYACPRSPSYHEMAAFYKLSSFDCDHVVTGSEHLPLTPEFNSEPVQMDDQHYRLLSKFYRKYAYPAIFRDGNNDIIKQRNIKKSSQMVIAGVQYRSALSSSKSGSYISAFFTQSNNQYKACYYGQVQYFFQNTLTINAVPIKHTFCFVRWYKNWGVSGQKYEEGGLEFWKSEFEKLDHFAILPVHCIYSPIAISKVIPTNANGRTGKVLVLPVGRRVLL
jgi:hypothetical protein